MSIVKFFRDLPETMGRVTSTKLRREIDGLRFFAILPVVLGHIVERAMRPINESGHLSHGEWEVLVHFLNHGAGVTLFFAISGYIIATQMSTVGPAILSGEYLKKYFWRRATRIFPPYFVVLAATFLMISGLHVDMSGARSFGRSEVSLPVSLGVSLLYSHGWLFGEFPRLYPPGWTLELEIQFYLVAPFLLYAYFAARNLYARFGLGVVMLIATTLLAHLVSNKAGWPYWGYTIAKYFPYFWLGVIMVDLQDLIIRHKVNSALLSLTGGIGLVVFFGVVWPALGHDPEFIDLQFALMAAIAALFAGVFSDKTALWRFCANPYISLIGSACYSIYLTHLQQVFFYSKIISSKITFPNAYAATAAQLAIELPLILVVSMTFYYFVERPFMTKDWPQKCIAYCRSRLGRAQSADQP